MSRLGNIHLSVEAPVSSSLTLLGLADDPLILAVVISTNLASTPSHQLK